MGLAAKHLDPIVGIDMHMVQPPPPAPPVMMPIPFAGYLIDPNDYGSCKVRLNGFPPARAGTPGIACPPHIPPGGMFVKPPTNECEMHQGSSVVVIAGDAAAAQGNPVLTCHDVGMPAPVRTWRKAPAKSLMMAAANVLPIPGASVVMINGAPTVSMTAAAQEEERSSETVLEAIDLEVYDGLEMPLAHEKFALYLPNGDVEEGTLDAMGCVHVDDVPVGFSLLVFPEIDALPEGRPTLALDPPMDCPDIAQSLPSGADTTRTIERDGDSYRALALRDGLVNWRASWLDGPNDAIREEGASPLHLRAGDVVSIRVPEVPCVRYLDEGVAVASAKKTIVHITQWPRRYMYSV